MRFGLGIDVGTTNTKVVVLAVDPADAAAVPAIRTTVQTPTPSDAAALRTEVRGLIETAVQTLDQPPDALGIASMAETGVPLDGDHRPLTPLLRWQDAASDEDAERLAAEYGRGHLFAATGVRPSRKTPLALWHWLRRVQPEVHRRLAHWAGVADWLHLGLTGRLVTDHTLAGRTMAYPLGAAGAWPAAFDTDLLDAVGLRPDQLPRVPRPGERPDALTDPALVDAGLRPGTPVTVAGHDHQVGAWAVGARNPGDVADSVGTAEAVLSLVEQLPDPDAVLAEGMSLVRTVGGGRAVLGGSSSSGRFAAWFADTYADGGLESAFTDPVAPAGPPTGTIALPYVAGRQCPAPDPSAEPRFLGPPSAYAALEGLACQAAWMIQAQARLTGHDPEHLTVIGAALQHSRTWAAIKAALSPVPVRLATSPEPVAAGAALLALVRADLVDPATRLATRRLPAPPGLAGPYAEQLETFIRSATTETRHHD